MLKMIKQKSKMTAEKMSTNAKNKALREQEEEQNCKKKRRALAKPTSKESVMQKK